MRQRLPAAALNVLMIGTPFQLSVLTLGILSFPLFLFLAHWLRVPWAFVTLLALSLGLFDTGRALSPLFSERSSRPNRWTTHGVVLLLIVAWALLSGAGGYSHQTSDYLMHNGRLLDLVQYRWPVIYPGDKPLAYYVGYYLPPAWVGKWLGSALARRLMLPWTSLLIWLAAEWLFWNVNRESVSMWLRFIFFSGMSVIGSYFYGFDSYPPDRMEWWVFEEVYVSYQSNTFQLFWAPHQVIIGWILMGFLFYLHRRQCYRPMPFVWTLSLLWAPLVSAGIAPYVLASLFRQQRQSGLRSLFSRLNLISVVLLGVLALYYLSGSATRNPHGWIWEHLRAIDFQHGFRLLLFYFLQFGLLLLVSASVIKTLPRRERDYVFVSIALLFLMPIYYYGKWNDLLTRGIVPSLWMLFWVFESALAQFDETGARFQRACLYTIFAIGVLTTYPTYYETFQKFGQTQAPVSGPDSPWAQEYLGDPNGFFFQHLAK